MQELGHLKEIRSLELNDPNALGNIVIHDITVMTSWVPRYKMAKVGADLRRTSELPVE